MGKRSSHVTSVIRFAAPDHPACNAIDQSEVARPGGEREQSYRRKIPSAKRRPTPTAGGDLAS
jgi:hypothetical protein